MRNLARVHSCRERTETRKRSQIAQTKQIKRSKHSYCLIMKTSVAAATALLALLPTSALSKKQSPHRVFRVSRSKAAKAEATGKHADPSPPPYETDLYLDSNTSVQSKAGKATGGDNWLKDFIPKAGKEAKAKAGKAKCTNNDIPDDLTDFDLMLDFSSLSLSMSTSMSFNPMAKSSKSPKSLKCHDGYYETMHDDYWYDGDHGHPFDDELYSNDDDEAVTDIISSFLEMMALCAGVSLDFDSCIVQSVIEVLASDSIEDHAVTSNRMLRGAGIRELQHADDQFECVLPTEDEIVSVGDEASNICQESSVYVAPEEYRSTLVSFIRIFTNETCVCGMY